MLIVAFIVGVAVGGLAVWLVLRERVSAHRRARDESDTAFRALSAEALQQSSTQFLELARTHLEGLQTRATADLEQRRQAVEELVRPLKDSLDKVDEHTRELEQSRRQAYGALTEQVRALRDAHEQLRRETGTLVKALRSPSVRGQWGQMQLQRTLEIAGMLPRADFFEQVTVSTEDGVLRPDAVVKLAGGKNLVIDVKTPLEALLDALEADDENVQVARFGDFTRNVRDHVSKLSAKAYWRQFDATPEFVVMFIANESFFRYAVERDVALLEHAARNRVILASPTTLISLLLAAACGWRDETLAESARRVSELGRDLYERLATMGGHFSNLGKRLERAVDAYNDTVGSLETRVLPAARRFPELGVSAKGELPDAEPIETTARRLTAPEMAEGPATVAELPGRSRDAA
jgi:DNA recombination protein RmuC